MLTNSLYIFFHEGSVQTDCSSFIEIFVFLLLICSSLNILHTHLLSGIIVLNTFSQPIAAFSFCDMCFKEPMF